MNQIDVLKDFYRKDKRWNQSFEMGASLGATSMKTRVAHIISSMVDDDTDESTKIFISSFLDILYDEDSDAVAIKVKENFDKELFKNLDKL